MVFGWATLLLFGRVPQSKQLLLAGVSAGALAWIVLLAGIAIPDFGSFLISLVPAPDFIEEGWIRSAMLVLAVLLPMAIGAGGLALMDPTDRPASVGGKAVQILRGYPYAAVLAAVILLLLVVAPSFKVRSIVKRWEDAHIPIIVKPGGYEQVAGELEEAVDSAGLDLQRVRAPRILEAPSRLLAIVGGESVRRLVPDRLVMLKAGSLEVTIHPSGRRNRRCQEFRGSCSSCDCRPDDQDRARPTSRSPRRPRSSRTSSVTCAPSIRPTPPSARRRTTA